MAFSDDRVSDTSRKRRTERESRKCCWKIFKRSGIRKIRKKSVFDVAVFVSTFDSGGKNESNRAKARRACESIRQGHNKKEGRGQPPYPKKSVLVKLHQLLISWQNAKT